MYFKKASIGFLSILMASLVLSVSWVGVSDGGRQRLAKSETSVLDRAKEEVASTTSSTIAPTTTVEANSERPTPSSVPSRSTSSSSTVVEKHTIDIWDKLAECETQGNWAETDAMPTYSGGLGFANQYWKQYGGTTKYPYQASRSEQIRVAEKILKDNGWNAWPGCSRKLGLK